MKNRNLAMMFSFWVVIVCLALAFSCLKASTFSAEEFRKSFRWAVLRSLIAFFFFTNIVKPRYFREFVFRNVGFGYSFVCNLNQSICNLSHWILRQGQLVRQPRHTQTAEGHPVTPVEFPMFSNMFIISMRSFYDYWEVIISAMTIMGFPFKVKRK